MVLRLAYANIVWCGYDRNIRTSVKRLGQTRIEWTLLALIAVVCVVLSFLQYRWTGELSKAEPALLRAGLTEQLRRLSQAFNNEIRENCTMLLPEPQEIGAIGASAALQRRYDEWASSHNKRYLRADRHRDTGKRRACSLRKRQNGPHRSLRLAGGLGRFAQGDDLPP